MVLFHLQRPWWALEWELLCLWAQEVALDMWEALTEDPVPGQSTVRPPPMQTLLMLPEVLCSLSEVSVVATMRNQTAPSLLLPSDMESCTSR